MMTPERLTKDLLDVLPYWNYKLVRPFKQSLSGKMSLEAYYCLQTVHCLGPMSMTDLARRVKVSKQQATKLVELLSAGGFLIRAENLDDRRSVKIAVTERAVAYIEGYYYQDKRFLEALERRLSPEDVEALGGALETLLRILPKLE